MPIRKILLSVALTTSLFSSSGDSLAYYKDGVYDTTSLINKYLREGLQETVLDQYNGKYLVATNLDKASFVDIIFFQNIAEKEQIPDVKIAKRMANGDNFMVFGSYERKADADMIQERLMESGVETSVIKNTEGKNAYVVNPLIVKKYLGDIRELIKDMPVKVIKVERTIAKDGAAPCLARNDSLTLPPPMGFDWVEDEFRQVESQWIAGGEVPTKVFNYVAFKRKSGALIGTKNFYMIGEKISCFTLTNIIHNDYANTDSIILLAPNGKTYTATKKSGIYKPVVKYKKPVIKYKNPKRVIKSARICSNGVQSDFCPEDGGSGANKPIDAPSGTKSNSVLCNFNGIKLVRMGSSAIKISDTTYAGKELGVSVLSKDSQYVTVKANGMKPVSIYSASYNEQCK